MNRLFEFIRKTIQLTFRYIWSKILASLVLGVIAYAAFDLMGVNAHGWMAAIVGITNLIPVAGGIFAAIVCGIIAAFQAPIYILYVILTIIVLQQLDQWILTPLIVGKSVSLPPILIAVVILAGGLLWGAPGILLAVPISGAVKIFYSMFIEKKKDPPQPNDETESEI